VKVIPHFELGIIMTVEQQNGMCVSQKKVYILYPSKSTQLEEHTESTIEAMEWVMDTPWENKLRQ